MSKKSKVQLIEPLPPQPPQDCETTVSASKDFPIRRGDVLIVRNASGRVTERYAVGDHLYTLEGTATYQSTLTRFDRA